MKEDEKLRRWEGGKENRIRKSDPASFRWSQNYAAAIDAEVGKK